MRPTAAVASSGSMYVVVHRHSTLISTDITGWPVPAARHRHYQPVDTATNETIIDFNKAYKYVHRSSMLLGLLSHPWDRALLLATARRVSSRRTPRARCHCQRIASRFASRPARRSTETIDSDMPQTTDHLWLLEPSCRPHTQPYLLPRANTIHCDGQCRIIAHCREHPTSD